MIIGQRNYQLLISSNELCQERDVNCKLTMDRRIYGQKLKEGLLFAYKIGSH